MTRASRARNTPISRFASASAEAAAGGRGSMPVAFDAVSNGEAPFGFPCPHEKSGEAILTHARTVPSQHAQRTGRRVIISIAGIASCTKGSSATGFQLRDLKALIEDAIPPSVPAGGEDFAHAEAGRTGECGESAHRL